MWPSAASCRPNPHEFVLGDVDRGWGRWKGELVLLILRNSDFEDCVPVFFI